MYKLIPIPIMKLALDKSLMTYFMNFGKTQNLYSNMWLIEGAKENIIVDTGASAKTISGHGYPSEQIQKPDDALAKYGLTYNDIDMLILTHLHLDHIEYAKNFKKAKIIVQKKEYSFAMKPHPMMAGLYIKEMFKSLPNIELVDGDIELLSGVKVLLTPGHTPGSQSIQIESKVGSIILSGLCTIRDNFYPPDENLNIITPGIHTNALQAYDSMERLKSLADVCISLHDETDAFKLSIP